MVSALDSGSSGLGSSSGWEHGVLFLRRRPDGPRDSFADTTARLLSQIRQ